MSEARLPRGTLPAAAIAFVVTAVYRFNLLGGQLAGFENDEFLVISRAAAMLRGDLPSRDFVDPGYPLAYVASAAAIHAASGTLLGHAVLSVFMLALGAALTLIVAARASRSVTVGVLAAAVQLALGPRFYNYPKIVLYAVAVLGWWGYVGSPTRWRVAVLGALTAVAFLFRHDHGVYIGIGTAVLLAARARETGLAVAGRTAAIYGGTALLVLAPYLVFLQQYGGVVEHLRVGAEFSRVDRARTQLRRPSFEFDTSRRLVEVSEAVPPPRPRIKLRWRQPVPLGVAETVARTYKLRPRDSSMPDGGEFEVTDDSPDTLRRLATDPLVADTQNIDQRLWRIRERPEPDQWSRIVAATPLLRTRLAPGVLRPENAVPFVYYLFLALPCAAAVVCAIRVLRRRDAAAWADVYRLAPVIAVMLLLNGWFLRGTLPIRLADVSVLAAAVGAWLLARAVAAARPYGVTMRAAVAVLLAAVSLTTVGSAMSIGVVLPNLRTATDGRGLDGVAPRAREIATLLQTPGPELAARSAASSPAMRLADYLHACLAPDERTLVAAYMPQVFYFADRLFAAGQVDVRAGYLADSRDQQAAVALMRRQAVPLVVTEPATVFEARYRRESPILAAHLDDAYSDAGDHDFGGESYRVLVRKSDLRRATRRDGLPCFH